MTDVIKHKLIENYDKYKREDLYPGRLYLSRDREDNRRMLESIEKDNYVVYRRGDVYILDISDTDYIELYLDDRLNMKSSNREYENIVNKTVVEKAIDILFTIVKQDKIDNVLSRIEYEDRVATDNQSSEVTLEELAREFNRYFTSHNGVDVDHKVPVSRDEWRKIFELITNGSTNRSKDISDEEVVVTAAVKVTYKQDDDVKSRVFLGVRHHAALQTKECHELRASGNVVEVIEGFVTNKLDDDGRSYRFVDRVEAMEIANDSNQQRRRNPSTIDGVLYSEDLY